ncbi:MAG: hypothetical protein LQ342_008240 [Letrouitia transgressa]|nr:MAG: hypothetical protein LQ342_008240 [Letrouitia transgressa]
MTAGVQKQTLHERRKGESALSEFAEYVEKQQSQLNQTKSISRNGPGQNAVTEHHAELDILDSLDLAETSAHVRLKQLLLDTSDESEDTLQQLEDVLQSRILEGNGETLFDLGQEDNGETMSFSKEQWDVALDRIRRASKPLRAECRVLLTRNVGGLEEVEKANEKDKSCTGKLLIRQTPKTTEDVIETRIAVVGNVDAGKSTMLGVLVKGSLDDGRGKARVNLFRHKHEIESGRTSSVGMEIMGFDVQGEIVASNVPGRKLSWEEIGKRSILLQTISQLTRILKSQGARKIPVFIKNREETVETATQFVSQRICPIFQVSNVTGESLDLVRTFLNILPHHGHYDDQAPFEFHVNDTFSVPFVGTVVSGIVKSGAYSNRAGVIHAGDQVIIGPDSLGQFTTTHIRSIERKRIQVPVCSAGQSASFALKRVRRKDVRKGMVVLPKLDISPKVYREFVAEVLILSHATTIKTKYQAMLHVGPISQTCAIIDIDRAFIRTGDRATVAFRFVQRPEYLAVGERILFREGRTKGLGIVKAVGYDPAHPLNPEAKGATESNGTTK